MKRVRSGKSARKRGRHFATFFAAVTTLATIAAIAAACVVTSCSLFGRRIPEVVTPMTLNALPGHDHIALDNAPKEELRLVPAEAYVRTYLQLFGGLAPLELQAKARAADGGQLFDTWDDYLSTLGFPDYRSDFPRGTQTNALMVATFERLGVALCDRAVEHDFKGSTTTKAPGPPPPVKERIIFAFETSQAPLDLAAFTPRFDVLHRTFLGYPAALAETDRTARFFALYQGTVARHANAPPIGGKARFTKEEAGWAIVCQGLIRHPEFHLY
ncbi:MAG: hypothetical protein NVS3B20_19360 [Polyangiales bacterium]